MKRPYVGTVTKEELSCCEEAHLYGLLSMHVRQLQLWWYSQFTCANIIWFEYDGSPFMQTRALLWSPQFELPALVLRMEHFEPKCHDSFIKRSGIKFTYLRHWEVLDLKFWTNSELSFYSVHNIHLFINLLLDFIALAFVSWAPLKWHFQDFIPPLVFH